jgi:hypothetical protein
MRSLELPNGVTIGATGLVCARQLSFDELVAVGHQLLKLDHKIPFLIGDWWIALGLRYGDGKEMAAAKKIFGYALHTIQNYASVARSVESSRRRETLSYSHHEKVAKFAPEQQTRWLDLAENEGLSVSQLSPKIDDDEVNSKVSRQKPPDRNPFYLLLRVKRAAETPAQFLEPPHKDADFLAYLKRTRGSKDFGDLLHSVENAKKFWDDTADALWQIQSEKVVRLVDFGKAGAR